MFLDRDPSDRRSFIQLHTAKGFTLTLTPSHLVPVVNEIGKNNITGSKEVFASKIKLNDTLLIRDKAENLVPDTVKSINYVRRKGVFAPLTVTGTVVVDNVVASCYAVINSQKTAHWAFAPIRWYYRVKSVFVDPAISSTTNEERNSGTKGVHWYAKVLLRLSRMILPKSMMYYDY